MTAGSVVGSQGHGGHFFPVSAGSLASFIELAQTRGSARRCATGEAGQSCLTANDCKSKRCDPVSDDTADYAFVCGA
jgi:hypothetical protein